MDDELRDGRIHFRHFSGWMKFLLIVVFLGSCSGSSTVVRNEDAATSIEVQELRDEVQALREELETR